MPLPLIHSNAETALTRIISKQMILDHLDEYRKAISFYRAYPDKLIDLMIEASGEDCTFVLLEYQRLFLRAMARHKEVYLTFSRGTAKSFTNGLWSIIQGTLYPNTKLAISATTKGQSGAIVEAKISEILALIPALNFEVRKTEKVKDSFILSLKGGSVIQNLAAKASSRGLRFTGVTLEEIIEGDPDLIQEVVLPTLAIQRRSANGEFNPDETITQQKVCVTTAGYKDTYAYYTLIRTLVRQIAEPGKAIVLGGSYKIPIIEGLQNIDFIRSQKNSGTFNPSSFDREYRSRWSAGSEKAYFPADTFERYRSIQDPSFERETPMEKGAGYIMSIDVGRLSDSSEIAIWKYVPQNGTTSTKYLVSLTALEKMHFRIQAIEIKLLYEKFKPERVVIDGGGLGVGLVDELIQSQMDVRTGQYLPPWGVFKDDKGQYTQYKTHDTVKDVLCIYKATAPFNTEMYSNLQVQLTTGKLRFLVDERQARLKAESSKAKKFKEMTSDEREDWLVPFTLTSVLRTQMTNLEEQTEGINIILKRANAKIKKDKVSAAGYGLYYIKTEIDDRALMRQTVSLADMMMLGSQTQSRQKKSGYLFKGARDYSFARR